MRLTELKLILDQLEYRDFLPTFKDNSIIGNLVKFRVLVRYLSDVPIYKDKLQPFLESSLFSASRDELQMSVREYNDLKYSTTLLQTSLIVGKDLCNAFAEEPNENSILIQLPEPNDFASAIHDMEMIENALEQTLYNDVIEGEIKLKNWERGSFWLTLYLGGPLAVALVGAMAWSAVVVWKKLQEGKLFSEHARSLNIHNKSLEDLVQAQEAAVRMVIELESTAVYNKYFGDGSDPEQLERLKLTIKTFSDLIARGAKIQPSLMQPEQADNLFPNFDKLIGVTSQIRQIPDK